MHHPLGVLYVSSFKKTENTEMLRVNGDRARLADYLRGIEEHPSLDVKYHEPLHFVRAGCWSALLTVSLVTAPVGD